MEPRIAVLALVGLALGTELYAYTAHLSSLAADLDVSLPAAGQLATAYTVAYGLTTPVTTGLLAGVQRRRLIVGGLLALAALNVAAATVSGFGVLIGLRILCGAIGGAVAPAAASAAITMARPGRTGHAMALVLAGTTLAFLVGIPFAGIVGSAAGWRATFAVAAGLAVLAAGGVFVAVPAGIGGETPGFAAVRRGLPPGVTFLLLLTLLGFAATFTVFAYIGPLAAAATGFDGVGIGLMQTGVGLGSLLGIAFGLRHADAARPWGLLAGAFAMSAVALVAFAFLVSTPVSQPWSTGGVMLALLLGSAAVFARTPLIQARIVAGPVGSRSVLLSLNGLMIFVGQGLGALLGGLALGRFGLASLGILSGGLALLGLAATLAAGGFSLAGRRSRPPDDRSPSGR